MHEAYLNVERKIFELQELRECSYELLAFDHVRLARFGALRELRALFVLDVLQVLEMQARVPTVAQIVFGYLLEAFSKCGAKIQCS